MPRPRVLRALTRLAQNLPTRGNEIELIHDGDALYRTMEHDIAAATQRIRLEMYMFLADETGWRIARALAERAQHGVEVRVVYDSLGSFGTSGRLWRFLRDAGVQVLEYRPVAPWRKRFALFGRNHRKIVVIDGRVGFTGGMNIGNQWAGRKRGGQNWRDLQARVEGPAAGDLEVLFADTWYRESGEMIDLEDPTDRPIPRERADHESTDTGQVYVIGGGFRGRHIRRLHLLAVGHARRRIQLTCSYFIPDHKFRRSLYHARDRNIDVELLVPGRSDVKITLLASRGLFARFLRRGIKIFSWQPSILHAKSTVVDGEWCLLGSANLDSLSFYFNLEANLVILDRAVGRELADRFQRDLRYSQQVDPTTWRHRPFLQKLLERLALLFGRWL